MFDRTFEDNTDLPSSLRRRSNNSIVMALMMTIRCMIIMMIRMINTGHSRGGASKAMKTEMYMDQGIISTGIRRLETTSSSTMTMMICGDRKQEYLPFLPLSFSLQVLLQRTKYPSCVNSGPSCNFVH